MNEEENKVEETAVEEAPAEEVKTEEVKAEAPAQEPTKETVAEDKKEVDIKDLAAMLKKNIKWIAVGVAALLLLCIIGSCAANSGSAFTLAENENVYYQKNMDTLVTLSGDEIVIDENISGVSYSADKSLTVIKDKDASLFFMEGKKLVQVAEEVSTYAVSNFGNSIAYIAEEKDGEGTLHLYNVSKKSDVVIDDEVYAGDIVLSADGKSVLYIKDAEVEGGWFGYGGSVKGSLYVSKNGKEGEKIAKDANPIAVTDGGKHVFYMKDGEKLYMDEKKLSSDSTSTFYFNDDYSEIIFVDDKYTQYFTVKMKDTVKVKKGSFSGIFAPEDVVNATVSVGNGAYTVVSYGVDTFNEKLWSIDYNEAYYVYKKGAETEKLSNYIKYYQMSENGKSMLYQNGGELLLISDITSSRSGERVAYGLYNSNGFEASKDLKDIYFYNDDEDELCFVKKGEGVHIADDAEIFLYSDKYDVVYFIEDDELFYATTTAKSKKQVCGEEVTSVFEVGGDVYFTYKDDDVYSVMKMTGKGKYKTVFEYEVGNLFNFFH